MHPKTPRHLVYGETGRYPLFVMTYTWCIKFWLRLTRMNNERYPQKAYNMLLYLQRQNYTTWACNIRNILFQFGFGEVWESQGVGNIKLFVRVFRQRLVDCCMQDWHSSLQSNTFYAPYALNKQTFGLCSYVDTVLNVGVRKVLTRFRIGMSPLKHHFLKFKAAKKDDDIFVPSVVFCLKQKHTFCWCVRNTMS